MLRHRLNHFCCLKLEFLAAALSLHLAVTRRTCPTIASKRGKALPFVAWTWCSLLCIPTAYGELLETVPGTTSGLYFLHANGPRSKITLRSMQSAANNMILSTQTNVCPKSTGNLQCAQSVAGRHMTAGLWDLWSTSIRPLISHAMLLACIAQLTGRLLLSWTLMSSGLKLCSCG